jgi:8-oxo-dGTP pyrophosphatase MutT (NUDIX family)
MTYRTERQVSSGGVIVRRHRGQSQVCLIARRSGQTLVWGLPKGHVEDREDPLTTALREVREETGLVGEAIAPLGAITYWFAVKEDKTRYFKRVHFYLMRYVDGNPRHHDHEVEDAAWVPLDEAHNRLSYPNERRILLIAQRYLRNSPLRVSSGTR